MLNLRGRVGWGGRLPSMFSPSPAGEVQWAYIRSHETCRVQNGKGLQRASFGNGFRRCKGTT